MGFKTWKINSTSGMTEFGSSWGRFEIFLRFQGDKYGEISGWFIFTLKDTRNPIKPMKMTENEIKWLSW